MEAWASQAFVGESNEKTVTYNATALGGVQVLDDLIAQIDGLKAEL